MNNVELKDLVKTTVLKSPLGYEKSLRKYKSEIVIMTGLETVRSFREHVYFLISDVSTAKCEICNSPTHFHNVVDGYAKTCSRRCAAVLGGRGQAKNDQSLRVEKMRKTNLEKYGVEHNFQREDVKLSIKKTIEDRYGKHYSLTDEYIAKIKETNNSRYGCDWWFQSEKSRQISSRVMNSKIESNFFEKYFARTANAKTWYETPDYFRKKYGDFAYDNATSTAEKTTNITEYASLLGLSRHKALNLGRHLRIDLSHHVRMSVFQSEVFNFVKSLTEEIALNDRNVLDGKEIDILVSSRNLGIECNGLFYHSDIFKSKTYHEEKFNLAKSKGLTLLQITDHAWNTKREIWESVIRAKIGFSSKVFARKCKIVEIKSGMKKFFDENHLQGYVNASRTIGLEFDGEVLAMMSFSKGRFGRTSDELMRFATKLGFNVVGGFSKLLKAYGKPLYSFANSNWSVGNVYEACGFKPAGSTGPGYVWFKGRDVKSRFSVAGENENERMRSQGYAKYHDAGNLVYEWLPE